MVGYPTVQGLEYTRCLNFTNIYLENFTTCSEERLYVFIITNQATTQDQRDQNIPQMKHTLIMTQTQLKLKLTQKAKMKEKTKLKHKTSLKTNHKRT